jgi:hypothetical protein
MVRKYIMIPIEYAEKCLDFVCNYEFKKGENKSCKCYGKLYKNNLCKTHYKIGNRNIDNKSILIKSHYKIIEDSKKTMNQYIKKKMRKK